MWSFIKDAPSFVQFVILVGGVTLGLSHVIRPQMWANYFTNLHAQGTSGVISRTFLFELWPSLLIVGLHQVWRGPAIVVTIYGWLMMAKVVVSMLAPEIGLRSLAAASEPRNFVIAGVALIGVGLCAGMALFWAA